MPIAYICEEVNRTVTIDFMVVVHSLQPADIRDLQHGSDSSFSGRRSFVSKERLQELAFPEGFGPNLSVPINFRTNLVLTKLDCN